MKTPKEKAKELLKKYFNIQEEIKWTNDDTIIKKYQEQYEEQSIEVEPYWKLLAKQCALIAVKEILKINRPSQIVYSEYKDNVLTEYTQEYYWEDVKKEIELL
jgi:hypothetical protein